jgi:hypothetical protein
MALQSKVRVTASLAGRALGEFREFSGGELTASDTKSARGGGQQERSRGGRKTVGNVTITREATDLDDRAWAAQHRGHPDKMTVNYQPLDDDDNAFGASTTYTGSLIRFALGDANADGDGTRDVVYEVSVSEVG